MALIDTANEYKESYFTANSVNGFSMDVYRKANMFRLFLSNDGNPISIFKAYYQGTFNLSAGLNIGSLNQTVMDTLSGFAGVATRSIIRSVSNELGMGSISGSFAAPLKPFIKGTEPLSFTLKGILPLIEKGDGTDDFNKNIQTPISDLLGVTLPWRSEAFDKVKAKFDEALESATNWLFDGSNGTFWNCVQSAVEGMKEDFLGGIYVLNEPLQYAKNNEIILRIGPWRVSGLLIEKVDVEYSPLLYTDGTAVYPSYASVTVHCKTKNPVTPDFLGISDSISSEIMNLNPKGVVK